MSPQAKTPGAADRPGGLFPAEEPDDRSGRVHRQSIGYLGLFLPLLLWLIAGLRPIEKLPRWGLLDSLSAYYYTGSVAAFVGVLVTLGVFLLAYQGYKNDHHKYDRSAAVIAGTAAFFVAFFPSSVPDGVPPLPWWTEWTGRIHYAAAAALFGAFSVFALLLFPKSKVPKGEKRPTDKQVRNGFYLVCGMGMVVSMVWALSTYFTRTPIFWPEVLALEFFALSWLVKGRVDRTVVAVARYGLHPGELVGDVMGALGVERGHRPAGG